MCAPCSNSVILPPTLRINFSTLYRDCCSSNHPAHWTILALLGMNWSPPAPICISIQCSPVFHIVSSTLCPKSDLGYQSNIQHKGLHARPFCCSLILSRSPWPKAAWTSMFSFFASTNADIFQVSVAMCAFSVFQLPHLNLAMLLHISFAACCMSQPNT